jgi:hypothetical protein
MEILLIILLQDNIRPQEPTAVRFDTAGGPILRARGEADGAPVNPGYASFSRNLQ